MGWISERAQRGNRIGGYNPNSVKNCAPLKKIVERIRPAESMFDQDRVLLECGHETNSNGIYRARCVECKKTHPLAGKE